MKNTGSKSDSTFLRRKAVEMLKNNTLKIGSHLSEADIIRLIHELEVHQIELDMQNEELLLAKENEAGATEKYTELYDFAPSGYFTLSRQAGIIELNLSGASMLGKNRSLLINSHFGFFVSEETKPTFRLFIEKIFTSKSNQTCEVALSTGDNEPKYVYLTGNVTGNEDRCLITAVDISERKQAEKALIASEIRYRRLFETAKDGILILDAETGKIVDVNPFLYKLLGFTEEQLIDKELWEIGLFKDVAENQAKFAELQKTKYVRYDNLPIETIDGRNIHVEFVSNVYLVGKKEVIQCNIRDITERKQAEDELIKAKKRAEESDRLKSAFLANMSHEIRTPMNGILGFAELLKQPDLTGEKQQRYISIIEKSGVRMLNIINDIINISRVDSGQMGVSISETNINEQIEFIYTFFRPEVEQKGLYLFYHNSLPVKEAILNTDREKVFAILTNLVKNALKFTKTGTIDFGYEKKDHHLVFFVRDTGVGIPADQLKIVFERFRQGSESLSRNYEGAGLGLSISKAYVEMLGGKIWVESEEGQGTTFYFTLPYEAKPENTIYEKDIVFVEDIEKDKTINNLNILIAEDDNESEMLLELALKKFSTKILKAKTGSDAVHICLEYPELDLVMMDIKMPEMDGYEATRQIRYFNQDLIIFAQTAYAKGGDREIALKAGCDDYISKPIMKDSLTALIRKHFSNREGTPKAGNKGYY